MMNCSSIWFILHPSTFILQASPHLHIAKPCRGRAVRHAHRLHWVAFATVGQSPDLPARAVCDSVARAPEVGRCPGVERIAQEPPDAGVLDLVRHFAADPGVE